MQPHNVWDIAAGRIRAVLETFPNNLFTRLRKELGFDKRHDAYPTAIEQEILLGQQPIAHVGPVHPCISELSEILNSPTEVIRLEEITSAGNLLCDAINAMSTLLTRLKDKYPSIVLSTDHVNEAPFTR